MDDAPENRRAAGLAANDAGRLAEAYRLLLPLAEAGDAELQGFVGSLMLFSLHRFENFEQINSGNGPAIDEATATADREQAARYLQAASEAGIGSATFNLATIYVCGYASGSWEERKARAADLYALAHTQGFRAFEWLTCSPGPGPYLDVVERHVSRVEGLREVKGGQAEAERIFQELSQGGQDITPAGYPGKLVELPNSRGTIGLRPASKSGPPTIDVNAVDAAGHPIPIEKIKFVD